jgi:predicted nucleic acid-binding protein
VKAVFADAGYWIALLHPHEGLHEKASQASRSLGQTRLITTEMVLTEVLNYYSNRGEQLRKASAELVNQLRQNPSISVVPQTSVQFEDARSHYANRPDKDWSLTDCASFLLMKKEGITEALAHDQHFEQAGFKALLR